MSDATNQRWLDAQIGVIGSVLIDPELAPKIISGTAASDYSGECRSAYNAIVALMQEQIPIDVITIRNRLGEASAGFLMECMKLTPTSANVEIYISICKEQSRLRQIQHLAMSLINAHTLDEAKGLVGKMNAHTVENSSRITTAQEMVSDFMTRHDGTKPTEFIDWGFSAVNEYLDVPKGKYVLLGGYPSDGKSALMLQMAIGQAEHLRVGIFSLETDTDTVSDRMMSHAAHVSLKDIIKNKLGLDAWQRLNAASSGIYKSSLEVIEASGMTAADIAATAISRNYQIIYVDYLQLIEPDSRRDIRSEQVAQISRQLQRLAKKQKITVVALSQLSRPEPGKKGYVPAPTLHSFRESGQLEQDADAALLLYKQDSTDTNSIRTLMIAKNKEGRANIGIALQFDGDTQTFRRPTHDEIRRLANKARKERLENYEQAKFSELEGADESQF